MAKIKEQWLVRRTVYEFQYVNIEYDEDEEDNPVTLAIDTALNNCDWDFSDEDLEAEYMELLETDDEPSTNPENTY